MGKVNEKEGRGNTRLRWKIGEIAGGNRSETTDQKSRRQKYQGEKEGGTYTEEMMCFKQIMNVFWTSKGKTCSNFL